MAHKLTHEDLDDLAFGYLRHDINPIGVNDTVGDALASLRRQNLGERLVYLYVTDASGKLLGVVPTRRLLMSDPDVPVRTLMVDNVRTLPSNSTIREASEMLLQTRLLALPVVDDGGRLHGLLDVSLFQDVHDAGNRRTAEDVFQLIGVHLTRSQSPWLRFKDRFPWLLSNVAGGLLCAAIAGHFESLLDVLVVLALFIPVVLALAESVSIQSVSLTLQALHAVRPDWTMLLRSLREEIPVAAMLGLGCGAIVGLVAIVWQRTLFVGIGLFAVIALSMLTASLIGVALPLVLRLLKRDPGIASGPIVLASADLMTLLFYFNLFETVSKRWHW